MKKISQFTLIFLCLLLLNDIQAQSFNLPWQKVTQVPSKPIYSINNINNQIYIAEGDKVYYSLNIGTTWNTSAALTPSPASSSDFIAFNGKLYLGTFGKGVFVSSDNGASWTQMNAGLGSLYPIKFVARGGMLYLATDDNGVYKLNSTGTQWSAFNNGIAGNWGSSFNCLESYAHGLMAGVSQNGYVLYHQDTSSIWKGSYLTGSLTPGLMAYDVAYTGSYIWAATNAQVYVSSNEGVSWTHVNGGMVSGFFSKMLQVSTTLYVVVNKAGDFYLYKRNILDPLTTHWTLVDKFTNFNCNGLIQVYSKLFVATSEGLYYLDTQTTGLNELNQEKELFTIYPNPTSDHVELYAATAESLKKISIYNLEGKIILTEQLSGNASLDVSSLKRGIYFVEAVFNNSAIQRKKLIIKK